MRVMVSTSFHREYRLIDADFQPHGQLDGTYSSHDEAWAEAVQWLEQLRASEDQAVLGLEVSTACGSWRILRRPSALLCAWPAVQASLTSSSGQIRSAA